MKKEKNLSNNQNIADLEELFQANVSERFNTSGRREQRIENDLLQQCESTTEISGKTLNKV